MTKRSYSKTWRYTGESGGEFIKDKLYTDDYRIGVTPTLYDENGMFHFAPDHPLGDNNKFTEISFNNYYEQLTP